MKRKAVVLSIIVIGLLATILPSEAAGKKLSEVVMVLGGVSFLCGLIGLIAVADND